jgi:DNA (cytosine-5)-methyltransferase 1
VSAWYNENDPRMADVLEELILQGHIAPDVVDRRSIVDVRAADLRGFTQCHFFAGIGVYSHALRRAGWADDRPVWTGSCPCQPFSLAGNGGGFDDPRHLWPHWVRLIAEHRPDVCFGEQVASAGAWLALVHADMESLGYAFGAPDLAAAGFAGAHIRQRFFWVADADNAEWWSDHAPRNLGDWSPAGRIEGYGDAAERGGPGGLADWPGFGRGQEHPNLGGGLVRVGEEGRPAGPSSSSSHGGLGHADQGGGRGLDLGLLGAQGGLGGGLRGVGDGAEHAGPDDRVVLSCRPQWEEIPFSPGTGTWRVSQRSLPARGVDWLLCRDNAWRPVEPGTLPLVDAAPARAGRLHGYGNAIDAETLTQFISAYLDALHNVF